MTSDNNTIMKQRELRQLENKLRKWEERQDCWIKTKRIGCWRTILIRLKRVTMKLEQTIRTFQRKLSLSESAVRWLVIAQSK